MLVLLLILLTSHPIHSNNDGGIYGRWKTDSFHLPSFDYTLDQLSDPRAKWPNSEDISLLQHQRRDHFRLFGNHRIQAMALVGLIIAFLQANNRLG